MIPSKVGYSSHGCDVTRSLPVPASQKRALDIEALPWTTRIQSSTKMNTSRSVSPLFPPTPRQARIFLLTLTGLALATTLPISRLFLLLISPWILGMTEMIFDRDGPVRNWLGPVIHSAFCPLLAAVYDWVVVQQWMRTRWLPPPALIVMINLLVFGCFGFFVAHLRPRFCPDCQTRSLVPLMTPVFREQRSNATHLCVSCSKQFWNHHGTWEPERRSTWWDHAGPGNQPHENWTTATVTGGAAAEISSE
jgi:hypothetical protein